MNILVLNCGSSSAKFAIIDSDTGEERLSGIAQRLGSPNASLDWKHAGQKRSKVLHHAEHDAALREVGALLDEIGIPLTPVRLKCALLGLGVLKVALHKSKGTPLPEEWGASSGEISVG